MSNYPAGAPSSDFTKNSIISSRDMSPSTVCAGIVDNHSAINEKTMRASVGYEISLLQNFANFTYLAREDTPILSGFISNLYSDYINVSDTLDLTDGVSRFKLTPYGGQIYEYSDTNPKLKLELDQVSLYEYGPGKNTTSISRTGGFNMTNQNDKNIKIDYNMIDLDQGTDHLEIDTDQLRVWTTGGDHVFLQSAPTLELASTGQWTDVFGLSELGLRSNGNINVVSHGQNSEINLSAQETGANIYITAYQDISVKAENGTLNLVSDAELHMEALSRGITIQADNVPDDDMLTVRAGGKVQAQMLYRTGTGLVAWWGGYDLTEIGKTGTDTVVKGVLKPDELYLETLNIDYIEVNKKITIQDENNSEAELQVVATYNNVVNDTSIKGHEVTCSTLNLGGAESTTYRADSLESIKDFEVLSVRDVLIDAQSGTLTLDAGEHIQASKEIKWGGYGDTLSIDAFNIKYDLDSSHAGTYDDGYTTYKDNGVNSSIVRPEVWGETRKKFYLGNDELSFSKAKIYNDSSPQVWQSIVIEPDRIRFGDDEADQIQILAYDNNLEVKADNQIDIVGDFGGFSTLTGELYISAANEMNLTADAGNINVTGSASMYTTVASDLEIVTTGNSGDILIQASRDIANASAGIVITNVNGAPDWGGNKDISIESAAELRFVNLPNSAPSTWWSVWVDPADGILRIKMP